jgi:hypothetical protein
MALKSSGTKQFLSAQVALLAAVILDLIGQGARQDAPEPGDEFTLALARKACEISVSFEECLLDQVRGFQFHAESSAHHRAGHQTQIVAVKVQQRAERGTIASAGLRDQEIGIGIAGHNPGLLAQSV